MTGGHYIANVKNERTGEWLCYDDSTCKPMTESQLHTKSAYILFYRRKDLANKTLKQIVPILN